MPPIIAALKAFDMPEVVVDYLHQNWDVLAASAYANYLKQGKGLLWIDWLNQLPITTPLSQVTLLYCTPNNAVGRSILKDVNPEVFQIIKRYTPEDSIVFRWNDGTMIRTRTLMVIGAETPIDTYKRLKDRLSEFEMLVTLEDDRNG